MTDQTPVETAAEAVVHEMGLLPDEMESQHMDAARGALASLTQHRDQHLDDSRHPRGDLMTDINLDAIRRSLDAATTHGFQIGGQARKDMLALLAEVERLRDWKAQAITVLTEWETTWEAVGMPGRLGQSKAQAVREGFRDAAAENSRLRAQVDAVRALADEWAADGLLTFHLAADELLAALDAHTPRGDACNCGWGGVHDPDNPRCDANGPQIAVYDFVTTDDETGKPW